MKRICCYPRSARKLATNCADGTHWHLSRHEAYEAEKEGLIEWITPPLHRKDRGIVRMIRTLGIRGLSAKIGAVLAVAVQEKKPWAEVMLANIRMRREEASAESLIAGERQLPWEASAVSTPAIS